MVHSEFCRGSRGERTLFASLPSVAGEVESVCFFFPILYVQAQMCQPEKQPSIKQWCHRSEDIESTLDGTVSFFLEICARIFNGPL